MKFCALLSGGKDSCYAITRLCREGHELVCCASLLPEPNATTDNDEGSYCFQTAGHTALPVLCDCLGVPLVSRKWSGVSVVRTLDYQPTEGDEVEDLFSLLKDVLRRFPCVSAVSSGAILSNYQRLRIENVCVRLGLLSLSPLWRQPQRLLLKEMIDSGLDAVLVKVSSLGLDPCKHLGRSIRDLFPVFERLWKEHRFHICGEGGEYETLSLNGPIFKKRLVLDETETVFLDGGTAALRIIRCHSEPKEEESLREQQQLWPPEQGLHTTPHIKVLTQMMNNYNVQLTQSASSPPPASSLVVNSHLQRTGIGHNQDSLTTTPFRSHIRPKMYGGIVYTAGITSPSDTKMQSYADQVRDCLLEADRCLREAGTSLRDICFVHLYISDMNQFKDVNRVYEEIFAAEGGGAPHSRCCVSGKPVICLNREGGMKDVMLDCLALPGSADAVKKEERFIRDVLHVRSRSHWAPLCIGPYCQANFVCHGGLSLVAGQIGLVPSTMMLAVGGPTSTTQDSMNPVGMDVELSQASANLAAVLQCNTHNGSSSSSILSSAALCITVFVVVGENTVPSEEWWMWVKQSVELLISTDWNKEEEDCNDDDQQEGMQEDVIIERNGIPIQCVGVDALPGGAICELEAIGTSKEVLNLLGEGRVEAVAADGLLCSSHFSRPDGATHCGKQGDENSLVSTCMMNSAHVKRCLCAGYVTLKTNQNSTTDLSPSYSARDIVNAIRVIVETSGLPWNALLHVRLYCSIYKISYCSLVGLICALQDEFASLCNSDKLKCPTTALPVITPIWVSALPPHEVVVAQLTCVDLDQLASRIWVHRSPV